MMIPFDQQQQATMSTFDMFMKMSRLVCVWLINEFCVASSEKRWSFIVCCHSVVAFSVFGFLVRWHLNTAPKCAFQQCHCRQQWLQIKIRISVSRTHTHERERMNILSNVQWSEQTILPSLQILSVYHHCCYYYRLFGSSTRSSRQSWLILIVQCSLLFVI